MRNPDLIKQVEYDGKNIDVIKIINPPPFDIEDYDFTSDKEMDKYFESIEKICRLSYEYKTLINFLRENMEMNKCSFYENVSNKDTYKIKIEIHHHPFTLGDIVRIVYRKRLDNNELLDEEMVAKEVMLLHYNLIIGLIPLSETVHELVHKNYLFIPMNKVLGNFNAFINMYDEYIKEIPEIQDNLDRNIDFTNSFVDSMDNNILTRKYLYLDFGGDNQLPKYEDVLKMMDQRIQDIKNGQDKVLIQPAVFH